MIPLFLSFALLMNAYAQQVTHPVEALTLDELKDKLTTIVEYHSHDMRSPILDLGDTHKKIGNEIQDQYPALMMGKYLLQAGVDCYLVSALGHVWLGVMVGDVEYFIDPSYKRFMNPRGWEELPFCFLGPAADLKKYMTFTSDHPWKEQFYLNQSTDGEKSQFSIDHDYDYFYQPLTRSHEELVQRIARVEAIVQFFDAADTTETPLVVRRPHILQPEVLKAGVTASLYVDAQGGLWKLDSFPEITGLHEVTSNADYSGNSYSFHTYLHNQSGACAEKIYDSHSAQMCAADEAFTPIFRELIRLNQDHIFFIRTELLKLDPAFLLEYLKTVDLTTTPDSFVLASYTEGAFHLSHSRYLCLGFSKILSGYLASRIRHDMGRIVYRNNQPQESQR